MEIHAHVPKLGKTAGHWLLEGLFIVVSVLLGFGVAQYREHQAERELAARALTSLTAEVEHNMTTVDKQIDFHGRWVHGLAEALQKPGPGSARDAFMATWPDLDLNNPKPPMSFLRRGALDAALSSGALRLIDYDIAAGLSEIYQLQDSLASIAEQMPYFTAGFFDPAVRQSTLLQTTWAMEATLYSEQELLESYRRTLPALRNASKDK